MIMSGGSYGVLRCLLTNVRVHRSYVSLLSEETQTSWKAGEEVGIEEVRIETIEGAMFSVCVCRKDRAFRCCQSVARNRQLAVASVLHFPECLSPQSFVISEHLPLILWAGANISIMGRPSDVS